MDHFLTEAYMAPLRRALRAIAAEQRGPCPHPVRLMFYANEELGATESETVMEHLSLCGRCARQVLRYHEFLKEDADMSVDIFQTDVATVRRLNESAKQKPTGKPAASKSRPQPTGKRAGGSRPVPTGKGGRR